MACAIVYGGRHIARGSLTVYILEERSGVTKGHGMGAVFTSAAGGGKTASP